MLTPEMVAKHWLLLANPSTKLSIEPFSERLVGDDNFNFADVSVIAKNLRLFPAEIVNLLRTRKNEVRIIIRTALLSQWRESQGTQAVTADSRADQSLTGKVIRHKTIEGLEYLVIGTVFRPRLNEILYFQVEHKVRGEKFKTIQLPFQYVRAKFLVVEEALRQL